MSSPHPSHPSFIVPPRSTKDIITFTSSLRKTLAIGDKELVKIDEIIEFGLQDLVKDYVLEIWEMDEMGNNEGLTLLNTNTIVLREDVYESLKRQGNRARFTAAHEVGHLLMRHNYVGLARAVNSPKIEAFRDSEWQAHTFAGTFLLSPEQAKAAGNHYSAAILAGISEQAAEITFKHYQKTGF